MSPTANFQKVILDQLYMPFLQKLLEAVAACNARGFEYRATSGYRDFQAQERFYAQGRTGPGAVNTDALPGYSAHNYGLAVDFARFVGGKALWDEASYAVLGEEAKRQGLQWGGEWHKPHDLCHVQWPGFVKTAQLEPLRAIYLANPQAPLTAVWAHLDGHKLQPAAPGVSA